MTTMTERMARALVGYQRYDDLPERATYLERQANPEAEWHDREGLRADMRRVLEAMREPTEAMVIAGNKWTSNAGGSFRAMIVAALAEGE